MAVSYNRLWKLLVDKKMSKADLRKASGVAPNTMTKLRSPSLGRYAKPLMPTTVTLWSMLMRKECRLCHAVADVAFLSLLLCHKAFLLRLYLDHAGYKSGSQAMSFLSYFPITALPTTIRWISLVPSKIWKIFASRMSFSTGYSRL